MITSYIIARHKLRMQDTLRASVTADRLTARTGPELPAPPVAATRFRNTGARSLSGESLIDAPPARASQAALAFLHAHWRPRAYGHADCGEQAVGAHRPASRGVVGEVPRTAGGHRPGSLALGAYCLPRGVAFSELLWH